MYKDSTTYENAGYRRREMFAQEDIPDAPQDIRVAEMLERWAILQEEEARAKASRRQLETELKATCTHPLDDRRLDETHHQGGYDYDASISYKLVCNVCEKLLGKGQG